MMNTIVKYKILSVTPKSRLHELSYLVLSDPAEAVSLDPMCDVSMFYVIWVLVCLIFYIGVFEYSEVIGVKIGLQMGVRHKICKK